MKMKNHKYCSMLPLLLAMLCAAPALVAHAETYNYDDAGRLTSVVYDDGTSIAYTYDSAGNIVKLQAAEADATPPSTSANPAGGTYASSQTATLSCDDGSGSGCAATYYTTDGAEPTTASSVYTGVIAINANTILKFFSVDVVDNSEAIKTETYVIQSGAGNNPPSAFNLSSPEDGAAGLGTTVTFTWKKATDPDGDNLTYQFYICENSDFSECTPTVVASVENAVLYAGGGALFGCLLLSLFGGGLGVRKRKLHMMLIISAMATMALFSACGGSGGGGGSTKADEISHTVSNLKAGTTYYWKVSASDGADARDSETRSFTTE